MTWQPANGSSSRASGTPWLSSSPSMRRSTSSSRTPRNSCECDLGRARSWIDCREGAPRAGLDRSGRAAGGAQPSPTGNVAAGDREGGGPWPARLELHPDGLGLEVGVEVGAALLAADAGGLVAAEGGRRVAPAPGVDVDVARLEHPRQLVGLGDVAGP